MSDGRRRRSREGGACIMHTQRVWRPATRHARAVDLARRYAATTRTALRLTRLVLSCVNAKPHPADSFSFRNGMQTRRDDFCYRAGRAPRLALDSARNPCSRVLSRFYSANLIVRLEVRGLFHTFRSLSG
ncbi:hypothetical protein PUN28_009958 [Cardiocondyla obscurior]|uniref:Uncharacterized protein n=1 Tax=Cardiocondyla obscurior TaxID=286306 RepID=A0AAW2FPQ8_9HYME